MLTATDHEPQSRYRGAAAMPRRPLLFLECDSTRGALIDFEIDFDSLRPPHPLSFLMVASKLTWRTFAERARHYAFSQDTLERDAARGLVDLAVRQERRSLLYDDPEARQSLSRLSRYVQTDSQVIAHRDEILVVLKRLVPRFDAIGTIAQADRRLSYYATRSDSLFYAPKVRAVLENAGTIDVRERNPAINWDNVRVYLLVGLLQTGDEHECHSAIHVLQTLTGLKFTSREEWTAWRLQPEGSHLLPRL